LQKDPTRLILRLNFCLERRTMRDFLKNLKLNEQNISMGLGVVVVVMVGALLFNYFRSINRVEKGETSSTTTESIPAPVPTELPAEYVAQTGDSLWVISEKAYGSGYNWVDVYAANRQVIGTNPDVLLEGTKLTLPKVEPRKVDVKIPVSYTVVGGDNLWNISVKICNNGYAWSGVAAQNGLKNPNLLYVGQVLKVVCN